MDTKYPYRHQYHHLYADNSCSILSSSHSNRLNDASTKIFLIEILVI